MWSEEFGWCRWDPHLEDYIPDPRLNPVSKDADEREQAEQPKPLGQSAVRGKAEVQGPSKRIFKLLGK